MDHDDDPCELWLSPLFVDPLIMEETALGPYWTNGSAFDEKKGAKYLLKQKKHQSHAKHHEHWFKSAMQGKSDKANFLDVHLRKAPNSSVMQ